MKKSKHFIYIGIFAGLILLCLLGLALQSNRTKGMAEIYLDGEKIRTVHWAALEQPIEIPVGEGNILCADGEGVWMKEADCPDQLCIKQGKIHSGNRSIICLPHRVTVVLKDVSSGWDGVAG
jgi:hypothetical protein